MEDIDEKLVGDLTIRIDRTLCVGFGDCVDEGELAFKLDEDGVAVFHRPDGVAPDVLIRACEACPVDALTVSDPLGQQLVP